MNKVKLKWRVQPEPTGRYRSFETRGFPYGDYPNGLTAANLVCKDEYVPSNIKTGNHSEITVRIAFWGNDNGFEWKTLKQKGKTLGEAKQIAEDFINKYPNVQPKQHHLSHVNTSN